MKYKIDLRMIQVYHTEVEASNVTELRKKIYESSNEWWNWTEEPYFDKIKSLHVFDKEAHKTIFSKEYPDGEEPITEDKSWKSLLKEVKIK